ncbi:hypothetical protein RUM44_007719 [Polyplax serrata]|uniref:Uncharacterized protein n=1 Tax=Polyplax serrata TaxID=468196 RepID=A0ABR1BAB4_POLSC
MAPRWHRASHGDEATRKGRKRKMPTPTPFPPGETCFIVKKDESFDKHQFKNMMKKRKGCRRKECDIEE